MTLLEKIDEALAAAQPESHDAALLTQMRRLAAALGASPAPTVAVDPGVVNTRNLRPNEEIYTPPPEEPPSPPETEFDPA